MVGYMKGYLKAQLNYFLFVVKLLVLVILICVRGRAVSFRN